VIKFITWTSVTPLYANVWYNTYNMVFLKHVHNLEVVVEIVVQCNNL
jgi:hypothetical protein